MEAVKNWDLESIVHKCERTGAEILVDTLNGLEVEYIFGHTGGAIIPIHKELNKRMENNEKTPRFVLSRQEGGAGHAAEGYAAASGKVGVVLATSGPGATGLVISIADAYKDSRPVVFLTGQVNQGSIGTDSFQEVDITGITNSISKHSYLIKEVDDLGWVLRQAFYLASSGRPGPVVVDICKNALTDSSKNGHESRPLRGYNPNIDLKKEDADLLLKELFNSKKPVILSGGGVINGDASEKLYQFIKKYDMPLTSTFMGLGAIPHDSDLFLGMPGMHGTVPANYALRDADFILAIGARFDDRVVTKDFGNGKKIAHVDIDGAELNKTITASYPLNADAKEFLQYTLQYAPQNITDISPWHKIINRWKQDFPLEYSNKGGSIKPQYAIQQISELTNGDAIITTGVGQHQMWTAQYYNFKHPRQWISSGGLGTMGFGVPAAIGAYFSNPSKQVVCIDGDGSFQMNLQELATISQYNIPLKVFVINNGYLGMVRQWEDGSNDKYHYETCLRRNDECDDACTIEGEDCDYSNPDIVKLSKGFPGIQASRITEKNELRPGIIKALKSDKPYLVDIRVNRTEDVRPMIPPGKSINDLIK